MTRLGFAFALATAALAAAAPSHAAPRWGADVRLGAAWNLPLPLVIHQQGEPELRVRARWRTRAFRPPLYYAIRVTRWEAGEGWALNLTHHKLYLADPPAEVEEFAISHGYNLLTLERHGDGDDALGGIGAGLVIAHPENRVRGRRLAERLGLLGTGYHLAGPSVAALATAAPPEGGRAFLALELRLTLSLARVPVAGGSARVPNAALHATAGVGWAGTR